MFFEFFALIFEMGVGVETNVEGGFTCTRKKRSTSGTWFNLLPPLPPSIKVKADSTSLRASVYSDRLPF